MPSSEVPSTRIRLEELAASLGLSKAAVSMALRDHPRIGEDTRVRVKSLAKALGYRPDPALSALAEYRRGRRPPNDYGTLAFIDPWPDARSNPGLAWRSAPGSLHRLILDGATRRAHELGYHLDFFNIDADPSRQRALVRALSWRGIRGVIIEDMPSQAFRLDLDWARQCTVALFKAPLLHDKVHVVGSDNPLQARVALEALEKLGYRRPLLVLEEEMIQRTDGAWLGEFEVWSRVHRDSALEQISTLVVPDSRAPSAPSQLLTRLKRDHTDVVVGTELTRELLRVAGLVIPTDIAFIHLDVTDDDIHTSGVFINRPVIGEVAVEFITGMLNRNQVGLPDHPRHITVQPVWREGRTAPARSVRSTPPKIAPGSRVGQRRR